MEQSLFPDNFISNSVKTDEELSKKFLEYPDLAPGYIAIALAKPDLREWYERRWPDFKKYLDKNFVSGFKNKEEHLSREWEFHIVSVLLDYGFTLKEKKWEIGPDFCIETGDKKVWVEAVSCSLGQTDPVEPMPIMGSGKLYSFGGNIEDINRPRALRITNAIATKFEQYKRYLDNPECDVSKNDCLVIAVNGNQIQHYSRPEALFKRAVFGQGPDILVRKAGTEKLQGGFYKPSLTIIKKVGDREEIIPANFMELKEFSTISVVIYSGNNISHSWLNDYKTGDDFIFAYHSIADNPMPEGFFRFGLGVRKNSATGQIEDKKQS